MMSFIAQAGYATAVVDFTSDLSSLFVGLIGVTALAAAMIVVEAIRAHTSRKPETASTMVPVATAYRQAA